MSQEPLSSFVMDLAGTDTSRPCIPNGDYVLQYVDFEIKPAKDGQGDNLFLSFQTTGPITSLPNSVGETQQIKPGYKLRECCLLWQHPNMEEPWRVKLGRVANALLNCDDASRPAQVDWAALRGKTLQATIKVKDDPEYGLRPEIKKYSPAPSV